MVFPGAFGHQHRAAPRAALAALILAACLTGASSLTAAAGTTAAATVTAGLSGWSVVGGPDLGPSSSDSSLGAVSCVTPASCVAVGSYRNASKGYSTLVEHFDGTSFAIELSPDNGPASAADTLNGVSCASASFCMAVGGYGEEALAERFDGRTWSVVPISSGPPRTSGGVLNAVDCAGPRACVAVGYFDLPNGRSETLAETWNGVLWSRVPIPNAGPAAAYRATAGATHDLLNGVSCSSPSFCAAVGLYVSTGGALRSLAEVWDGRAWSISPSQNEGSGNSGIDLAGVSCASPRSCVAVGDYEGGSDGTRTVVASFSGTAWSLEQSPDPGPASLDDSLGGVSCLTARSCVAVGDAAATAAGSGHPLVVSSNGAAWSALASPGEGRASGLAAVSCAAPGRCLAVGGYEAASGIYRTLAEVS